MKFAAIADWADSGEFFVVFMRQELQVSRSGFYAWCGGVPSARATADEVLTALIIKICVLGLVIPVGPGRLGGLGPPGRR